MTRVIIHTGRDNYRSLKVTKANELKLVSMFEAKEVLGVVNIKVSEANYKAIFKLA